MSGNAPQKSNTALYVGIGCAVFFFLGIPMIGILAAIAIPNFVSYQYKAKQAEVKLNLAEIKNAQIMYDADNDMFVEAGPYPGYPSTEEQVWVPALSGGFQTLGWAPSGGVRGSYSVTTTATDFRAVGIMDIDGDGNFATFVATKSTTPYQVTPPNVY